jgi:hypothetical protein
LAKTVGKDVVGDVAEGTCSFLFTTKMATQVGEQVILPRFYGVREQKKKLISF